MRVRKHSNGSAPERDAAFDAAPAALALIDRELRVARASAALQAMLGPVEGRPLSELVHADDADAAVGRVRAAFEGMHAEQARDERWLGHAGPVWVSVSCAAAGDDVVLHLAPVEDRRALARELDRRDADLAALAGAAGSVVCTVDPVSEVCAVAVRVLAADLAAVLLADDLGGLRLAGSHGRALAAGWTADIARGVPAANGATAGERRFVADAREHPDVPQALIDNTGIVSVVLEPLPAGGAEGVLAVGWRSPVDDPAGREAGLLRVLAATSAAAVDRRALLGLLRDLARTDAVTGLANRRAWEERLEVEVARARRRNTPVSVILLGLEHFREYVEMHGAAAADDLLARASALWSESLRTEDLLARLDGDAFGLVLPECDEEDARMIAGRMRRESAGLAAFTAGVTGYAGEETPGELMSRARAALADARHARALS